MTTKARKWTVLGAMVATMLATSLAFGGVPPPCWEAYLQSGLSQQQMGFEEFRELYGDTCAPEVARSTGTPASADG